MNFFPEKLHVSNKDNLNELYKEYIQTKLRKSLFEFITKGNESDFFDIDMFISRNEIDKNLVSVEDVFKPVLDELKQLGWNHSYSRGNSILFIHSSAEPPPNCFDYIDYM